VEDRPEREHEAAVRGCCVGEALRGQSAAARCWERISPGHFVAWGERLMALNPLVQRALEQRSSMAPSMPQVSLQEQGLKQQQLQAQNQWNTAVGGSTGTGMAGGGNLPADLARVLQTIRSRESGGRYDAKVDGWNPNTRTASGAYMFTKDTWNGYGGYQYAFQAPREVQDARAAQDAQRFLAMGGPEAVAGMWFRPATYMNRSQWDIPIAGNHGLTMRRYINDWLRTYNSWG